METHLDLIGKEDREQKAYPFGSYSLREFPFSFNGAPACD